MHDTPSSSRHRLDERVRERRTSAFALLLLALLLCGAGLPLSAQEATFQVASEIVLVPVTVEDAQGTPVRNLRKEDFVLLEDGRQQELAYFRDQETPLSVAILVDSSSSMRGVQWRQAEQAAVRFIDEATPGTEVSLVAVAPESNPTPFTTERDQLKTLLQGMEVKGGTAFFDAVTRSIEFLAERGQWDRKALLILSDGMDFDSRCDFSTVERKIQASPVVIFSVGTLSAGEREVFENGKQYYKLPRLEENLNPVWILDHFATVTGGRFFLPAPGQPPAPLFQTIAEELKHQYVLGYRPEAGGTGIHQIEVRLAPGAGRGEARIRSRKAHLR